ncbi:DNA-binding protein snt1 [Coemansia biformis]|uniref:DNA-binding protein snt1 n=1 Tax=Coemansia biformis TaxID=1286918 RepID=A0A9W7YEJ6_9FUNG|nr:DNA-binding protein snt1 [Coemansia biformis]
MEAAAECAPTDHSVGTKTSDDEATVDTTGILERRSRGNALLRSIINANRERKRESLDKAGSLLAMDGSVTGIDDLTPAIYTPDDELSDDMSPTAPVQPTLATDQRGLPATAAVTAAAVAAVAEAAAGEAVEVAAEASEDADDDDDDEEDEEEEGELVEDAQWEPRRLHARENGRAGSDSDEIVEASGVVAERSSPLIVSRRSQSRFGAMFTAVLDDSQCSLPTRTPEAADSLRESALDRFVAEHPAPRRPLSSHGTLRICHTDGGDEARLDAVVDEQAGEQDEILVGAAVWQLGDRRRVLRALHRLGADFAQVASLMPSKTTAQCRYFYYHYRTPAGALISEVISGASPKKAPAIPQPDALVLPPALSANANASTGTGTSTSTSGHAGGAGSQLLVPEMPAPKRARTLSPTGSDDSNDDDDDEMPLATQLAEELAALQPPHHASELVLVRPTAASPLAATPVPGLVLPRPAPSGMSPVQPLTGTSNPSPHTATAKKSGYSSYWSVHERSAFMHHVSRLGQNWLALADAIGSKTATQVRNYFRANREKLGLDVIIIEYERNRAAGTLPPPVPFTPVSAKDEAQARKEKRGRKRKGDAAKSPRAGSPEEPANTASTPNTAPANMTSFPTMGVDGGRAVVFARPPLPAAEPRSPKPAAPHPPMHDRPPAPSYSLPAGQQLPRLHPWGRPPQHHSLPLPTGSAQQQQPPHVAIRLVSEPSAEIDLRASVAGRDDSSTPLSQPTPPPVEGLRLSSSPGPGAVPAIASSRGRQMSVLNIANLTESTAAPVPRPSLPEEPRKVSVTKINALLNDDSPGASHVSSDWFNDDPAPASQAEDEATGIAALALASMMGAARSSHQPAFQPRQQQQPPRQQHQEPLPRLQQRQQQPLPLLQPQPQSQMRTAAVSAFSPVVNTTMSPADFTMTRPSSTGPSTYTGPMRQRKPSAPPQPTTTLFPPRASFSSYHQHAMMSPLAGPSEVPLVRTPTLLPSQGMARQPYSPHMGARPGTYPEPPHPRYPEPMERHQSPRPHYAPHQHYYYPPLSPGRQQHQHQHQQQHQQQHHLQQRQQPGHAPGSQGYHPPPHHNSMPPYHHHHHPAPPPPPM